DANYALAYAGLADCYSLLPQWASGVLAECLSKARTAADKALEIDGNLVEAHVSRAFPSYCDLKFEESKREFERAIDLNPNYATAHHWFGYTSLLTPADFDRAIGSLKKAVELDPFSAITNANLGNVYIATRRYPEAIVQLRK